MGKKVQITDELKINVKTLFDMNLGSRKIAERLGVSRWIVQETYKLLNIYDIGRINPKTIINRTKYTCIECNVEKPLASFRIRERNNNIVHESICIECEKKYNNKRLKARAKRLRKTDPNFAVRQSVSHLIWRTLKNNNSSKDGESCLNYLGYTIDDLKQHLELLFEPWMSWNNYGKYDSKIWNDNDQKTWTWQIDHIIPQSDLPYTNMNDNNFKKCWSLENLRPLSSKQNNLDGVNGVRHNKAA